VPFWRPKQGDQKQRARTWEMVARIARSDCSSYDDVKVSPFLNVTVLLLFLDVAVLPFLDGASTVQLFYKKCN
jgi:hypothetical protein